MIPEDLKALLLRQHYKLVGNHSAVKTCEWLRRSIRGQDVCYKQQFYGIQSHRCLQMTPAVAYCSQKCVFCWRPTEFTLDPAEQDQQGWDEPGYIVDESIKAHRLLISGFGGYGKADEQKFKEAQEPTQAAISLSGEPTLYPHLGGLVKAFHDRGFESTYVVTNGNFPERIEAMSASGCLPTQLYLSLEAPNEALYKKIDLPLLSDGWQRINKTLDLFPLLDTKKAIRLTLIKGLNSAPELIPGFAKLISRAQPDYVEVKSYMCVGYSRKRGLTLDNMLSQQEIADYAQSLADALSYRLADQKPESRVALLSSN